MHSGVRGFSVYRSDISHTAHLNVAAKSYLVLCIVSDCVAEMQSIGGGPLKVGIRRRE